MKMLIALCVVAGFMLSACQNAPKQEIVYIYVTNTVTREIIRPAPGSTAPRTNYPASTRGRKMTNSVPVVK